MAINSVSYGPTYLNQSLLNLNSQLTTLQSQLTTGTKSTTYAGMGVNEGFAIAARAQLANISAFSDTMSNINTNIGIANTALQSMVDIGTTVLNSANGSSQALNSAGQSIAQQTATSQLSSMLGILNMQAGDRYLFSGSAINTPSVASADNIINGTTTQAGLKQVISERAQADGTSGLGRLVLSSPTPTSVQVAEDVAGSPFGLKLSAVSSTLTGATVTGPAGSPAAVSVDLGATNPNNGDQVSFAFKLPDGTTESIQLTATTTNPPPTGSFLIDPPPASSTTTTAANLKTALKQRSARLPIPRWWPRRRLRPATIFSIRPERRQEAWSTTRLRPLRRSPARRCCPVPRARTRWPPTSRPATPSPSTAPPLRLSPPARLATTSSTSPTASRRC